MVVVETHQHQQLEASPQLALTHVLCKVFSSHSSPPPRLEKNKNKNKKQEREENKKGEEYQFGLNYLTARGISGQVPSVPRKRSGDRHAIGSDLARAYLERIR